MRVRVKLFSVGKFVVNSYDFHILHVIPQKFVCICEVKWKARTCLYSCVD